MTAAGIVTLFSGLSAASSGAHGSVGGLLSMLSAMRYVIVSSLFYPQLTYIIASCSVSASVQNILAVPSLPLSNLKNLVSARGRRTVGSRLQRVKRPFFQVVSYKYLTPFTDSMIDFGFVISAFVPLVLFWM